MSSPPSSVVTASRPPRERLRFGTLRQPKPGDVIHVDERGPAHRAGLRAGDVILAVGGLAARDSAGLARLSSTATPGQTLRYRFRRP